MKSASANNISRRSKTLQAYEAARSIHDDSLSSIDVNENQDSAMKLIQEFYNEEKQ